VKKLSNYTSGKFFRASMAAFDEKGFSGWIG